MCRRAVVVVVLLLLYCDKSRVRVRVSGSVGRGVLLRMEEEGVETR